MDQQRTADEPTNEQIREEMRRFRDALPHLLTEHCGKWVVFVDGKVVSAHDNQDQAYTEGVHMFGIDRPFVVAEVVEDPGPVPTPTPTNSRS